MRAKMERFRQGGPMSTPQRDPYPDALRAGALLVVVLGHWIATLPRLRDGRLAQTEHLLAAWDGALALARPTVTYLAVLVLLAVAALASGGRLLGLFDQSLTVHLWFLLMLLTVQALLPWSLRMDERWGLGAVAGLVVVAAALDVLRADVSSARDLAALGSRVAQRPPGIAWLNMLVVWLLPQQLGIAWKRGRFRGPPAGVALLAL